MLTLSNVIDKSIPLSITCPNGFLTLIFRCRHSEGGGPRRRVDFRDERLKPKSEGSTLLTYSGFRGGLEVDFEM
jgi:hypothetical protein